MDTVILDGHEYIIRCDLNVIEKIEEKYGTFSEMVSHQTDIGCIKFLLAEMINEHLYYTGSHERVTENFVGARLNLMEYKSITATVLKCLTDCISPKN